MQRSCELRKRGKNTFLKQLKKSSKNRPVFSYIFQYFVFLLIGQVYIYSAFYDARPDIDWLQARIIAVAEYDVRTYQLCCLLWYRSQRLPDVAEIGVLQAGPKISLEGQSTVLEQFIFSCRLDPNKTDAPTHVSVLAPYNFRVSNLLPVQVGVMCDLR